MMKVKRKRGKELALSCWYDRESYLAEFIPSAGNTPDEDVNIEWFSDDEKDEQDDQNPTHKKPPGKIHVPLKKMTQSLKKGRISDSESEGYYKDEKVTHSGYTKISEPKSDGKITTLAQDNIVENQSLTTEHRITGTEAVLHPDIKVDPLLMKDYDSDDDLHITQVSNTESSPNVTEMDRSKYSENDTAPKNDCTSPILGSKRFARKPGKFADNIRVISNDGCTSPVIGSPRFATKPRRVVPFPSFETLNGCTSPVLGSPRFSTKLKRVVPFPSFEAHDRSRVTMNTELSDGQKSMTELNVNKENDPVKQKGSLEFVEESPGMSDPYTSTEKDPVRNIVHRKTFSIPFHPSVRKPSDIKEGNCQEVERKISDGQKKINDCALGFDTDARTEKDPVRNMVHRKTSSIPFHPSVRKPGDIEEGNCQEVERKISDGKKKMNDCGFHKDVITEKDPIRNVVHRKSTCFTFHPLVRNDNKEGNEEDVIGGSNTLPHINKRNTTKTLELNDTGTGNNLLKDTYTSVHQKTLKSLQTNPGEVIAENMKDSPEIHNTKKVPETMKIYHFDSHITAIKESLHEGSIENQIYNPECKESNVENLIDKQGHQNSNANHQINSSQYQNSNADQIESSQYQNSNADHQINTSQYQNSNGGHQINTSHQNSNAGHFIDNPLPHQSFTQYQNSNAYHQIESSHQDSNADHFIDDPLPHQSPNLDDNDSQEDYHIDVLATPTKSSQQSTNSSLDSTNPKISSESTNSSDTMKEDGNIGLRSGFNWIKCLQQQKTPQKLTTGDAEETVESAKKKYLKDGEAVRLQRLIMSWQSSINTWIHQMSLPGFSKTNLPKSSEIRDNIQNLSTSLQKQGKFKQESIDKLSVPSESPNLKQEGTGVQNMSRVRQSPAFRNLHDLLIESQASSPGSNLNHIQIPVSKKYLELSVIRVGGRYPGNSALCELMSSSEEVLGKSIKLEGNSDNGRRKYLVFFSLQEHKITSPLSLNDIAKVYAPWQILNLPLHDVPVLFSSYFSLTRAPVHIKGEIRRYNENILCLWNCSCSSNSRVLPSMCEAHRTSWRRMASTNSPMNRLSLPSVFSTIANSPEDSEPKEGSHTWTVLEGIERCGGALEVPISLTTRIHRSIPQRGNNREIEEWILVCQDASGVFCTVRVPNRPLALKFSSLLEGESSGTHTLTHLTIIHRLTNTQNPGLFSLISSLQSAYQRAVCCDPGLPQVLSCPRPPQTSCYCFTVNLGSTSLLPCPEEVVLPLTLPNWSLQQAFEVRSEGQRGSLSLHLLYIIDSFLYVIDGKQCKNSQEIRKSIGTSDINNSSENSSNEIQNTPNTETKQTNNLQNKNTVKKLMGVSDINNSSENSTNEIQNTPNAEMKQTDNLQNKNTVKKLMGVSDINNSSENIAASENNSSNEIQNTPNTETKPTNNPQNKNTVQKLMGVSDINNSRNETQNSPNTETKPTNNLQNKNTVKKLIVTNKSSLPSWIPEEGTVMQKSKLRDVVIWRGNIMIDEYTTVHKVEDDDDGKGEGRGILSLNTLIKVLCPLSSLTQQHDLTLLKGEIVKIDEETAYTWPICAKCGSESVKDMGEGMNMESERMGEGRNMESESMREGRNMESESIKNLGEGLNMGSESLGEGLNIKRGEFDRSGVKCYTCGARSNPARGYSLQVWVSSRPKLEEGEVKVKLYQRTIEKLLNNCSNSVNEEHDVQSFEGVNIGPLVCVVQSVSKFKHSTNPHRYFLAELPY